MWIDLVALLVVMVFAMAGAASGGTGQLLRIAAAVCAVVFAPVAARALAGPIGGALPELSASGVLGVGLIAGAGLIYFSLSLLVWVVTDLLIKRIVVLNLADRALGLTLGLVKAAVLLFVLGHGLLALQPTWGQPAVDNSRLVLLVGKVRVERLVDVRAIEQRLL